MTTGIKPLVNFVQWAEDNLMEVEQAQALLAERLSDSPSVLYEQLAKVEAWQGRMTTLLADANAYLDMAERAALQSREERMTDLDRKVIQAAMVVNERRIRDILDGVCESIKTKLILGMSLSKQNYSERTAYSA